ncbi:hypothetical protein AAK964_14715 [Tissierella praeacuta]|uniref:hypothetical protein n=1 Tax=Tissierella praeacuta TaxID=43131 RepID=UPI003511B0D2
MNIKADLKQNFNEILKQYKTKDTVLFQLKYKNMLHINLSEKYPYLEDNSLNEDYVKECTEKAMEVYKINVKNTNRRSFTNRR